MNITSELALLLVALTKHELDTETSSRMTIVVATNSEAFAQVRDDLWQRGEQQAATSVDRLISTYQHLSPLVTINQPVIA